MVTKISDVLFLLNGSNREYEEREEEKRLGRIKNFSPKCCSCNGYLGGSVGGFYCVNPSCHLS